MEHRRRRIALDLLGIPHRGPAAFRQIARLAGHVERCRFDLWPEFLRSGLKRWALVDVGANEGEFIESVCALSKPAQVVAFEPLPEMGTALERLSSLHPRARVIAAAAGDKPGTLALNLTRNRKLSSVLEPRETMDQHYRGSINVVSRIDVPVTTLDAELPQDTAVGLLKIDVQGFEPQVLDGARETLSRTAVVMLEINYTEHYASGGEFEDVHDRLTGAGFRLGGVSCPHMSRGVALWADAVYVNRTFEPGGERA